MITVTKINGNIQKRATYLGTYPQNLFQSNFRIRNESPCELNSLFLWLTQVSSSRYFNYFIHAACTSVGFQQLYGQQATPRLVLSLSSRVYSPPPFLRPLITITITALLHLDTTFSPPCVCFKCRINLPIISLAAIQNRNSIRGLRGERRTGVENQSTPVTRTLLIVAGRRM